TELEPLRDELAVLVEDLDAVVLTVADKQPAPGIEDECVDKVELAGAHAFLPPRLDEPAALVELRDRRATGAGAAAGVPVPDEKNGVRSDRHFGRRIELVEAG